MSEVTLESQLIDIIKDVDMADHIKYAKIDMLIRLGVDVNAMCGARSPLRFAKDNNLEKFVELLENNGAKDVFDEEKAKELGLELCEIYESEAENINIAKVKELINMGVDVNQKDKYGWTALMWASRYGHKEIAELLIKAKADVNATVEYFKGTALMQASCSGHKEIVELLIKNGADVHSKCNKGSTALMDASAYGYKEIVELLIQNGADVNAKSVSGGTALMEASGCGYKEIVELLILSGADVNAKNIIGDTALIIAKDEETRKAIIEAVKKREEKARENVIIQGFERE